MLFYEYTKKYLTFCSFSLCFFNRIHDLFVLTRGYHRFCREERSVNEIGLTKGDVVYRFYFYNAVLSV